MKKLKLVLATIGLCALLLLPGTTLKGAQVLDDLRFINAEETIGKTFQEVSKAMGEPDNKGDCHMSTPVDGKIMTLSGEGWAYQHMHNNGYSRLSICFVQGLSVAELRTDGHIGKNGQQRMLIREVLDHKLMRNIIDGYPARPEWFDPNGDKI